VLRHDVRPRTEENSSVETASHLVRGTHEFGATLGKDVNIWKQVIELGGVKLE
jgi:hypothetical protein